MNRIKQFLFQRFIIMTLVLFFCIPTALAATAKVNGFRMWASPDGTRLVIDLSRSVSHRLNLLSNPERIVVDIDKTRLKKAISGMDYKKGVVAGISSIQKGSKVRLVLDLKKKVKPQSFLLKPNKKYGYRLVIDLKEAEKQDLNSTVKIVKSVNSTQKRDLIIAIDAGHGGEDPGATGPKGTKEKNVALAIARKLRNLVNKKPGMKAVMIRNGDYYISLRGRTKKARNLGADIFISIHADAFKDPKAHGSSVFILSSRGATSEAAKWLAKKENEADLVGGVSLDDKDTMLARMLLDLSQTACIDASNNAATGVISHLSKIGPAHKRKVERAGFVVLKSPDIPSLLIETGFISNPKEERLLKQSNYQNKIAHAILKGVNGYFQQYPLPGTIYAKQDVVVKKLSQSVMSDNVVVTKLAHSNTKTARNTKILRNTRTRTTPRNTRTTRTTPGNTRTHSWNKPRKHKYKVVQGDTLSAISRRYEVSVAALKRENRMTNNILYVGKTLRIPRS